MDPQMDLEDRLDRQWKTNGEEPDACEVDGKQFCRGKLIFGY